MMLQGQHQIFKGKKPGKKGRARGIRRKIKGKKRAAHQGPGGTFARRQKGARVRGRDELLEGEMPEQQKVNIEVRGRKPAQSPTNEKVSLAGAPAGHPS